MKKYKAIETEGKDDKIMIIFYIFGSIISLIIFALFIKVIIYSQSLANILSLSLFLLSFIFSLSIYLWNAFELGIQIRKNLLYNTLKEELSISNKVDQKLILILEKLFKELFENSFYKNSDKNNQILKWMESLKNIK